MKHFLPGFRLMIIFFLLLAVKTNAHDRDNNANTSKLANAHVYFSTEIPVGGNAKEETEFTIATDGGYAYLVVNNYPDNFNYDELKVKVKKAIGGSDEAFDSKIYTIKSNVFSTYIKYSFFSSGFYSFDVYSKYGNLVGSTTVTIKVGSSSSSSSSSPSTDDCIASSYKQYYNSTMGFSLCIPKDGYVETAGEDKMTLKGFYGKELTISFMQEPHSGVDAFDASVVQQTKDILGESFTSYYRKDFKIVSSKGDNIIFRSVVSARSKGGIVFSRSKYYIKMNGNKIRGKDYMVVSGPFVDPSDDDTYQTIIELGMLSHLKIY